MFYEDENEKDIIDSSDDIQISEDGVVSWGSITEDIPDDISVVEDEPDMVSAMADEIELVPSDNESDEMEEDELKKLLEDGDDAEPVESLEEADDMDFGTDDPLDMEIPASADEITPRNAPKKQSSSLPILLALLVAILFVGVGYYLYNYFQDNPVSNEPLTPNSQANEVTQEELARRNEIPEDIPVVNEENQNILQPTDEQDAEKEEKKEVVNIKPEGRSNPFLPDSRYLTTTIPQTYINFENSSIPQPPKVIPEKDEEVAKMLSIAVSGIMYDEVKPSAIITYESNDYFVQKGDMLDNYRVTDITKSYVLIASGRNTYKANVGEEFKITNDFAGSAKYLKSGRQYLTERDSDKKSERMVTIDAD